MGGDRLAVVLGIREIAGARPAALPGRSGSSNLPAVASTYVPTPATYSNPVSRSLRERQKLNLLCSPSLMIDSPVSACVRLALVVEQHTQSISGRGNDPVWLVSMRSVLRCIGLLQLLAHLVAAAGAPVADELVE